MSYIIEEVFPGRFKTTDNKLFDTYAKALYHEIEIRIFGDKNFIDDKIYRIDNFDKMLRFISENPKLIRHILDNYNAENPEERKHSNNTEVPVKELEKLEQARIQLFDFINEWVPADKQDGILTPLLNITNQMWIVANRRDWNE